MRFGRVGFSCENKLNLRSIAEFLLCKRSGILNASVNNVHNVALCGENGKAETVHVDTVRATADVGNIWIVMHTGAIFTVVFDGRWWSILAQCSDSFVSPQQFRNTGLESRLCEISTK